jgi:hypothetical protein
LYKKISPDRKGDVLFVPEILSDRSRDVMRTQENLARQERWMCYFYKRSFLTGKSVLVMQKILSDGTILTGHTVPTYILYITVIS